MPLPAGFYTTKTHRVISLLRSNWSHSSDTNHKPDLLVLALGRGSTAATWRDRIGA